jgi:hypothetical protein
MNFLGSVPDRRLPHWQDVEPSRPLPGFVVEYESGMPPETPSPVTGPVEFQRFTVRMQRPGNWWVEGVQFSEADSPGNKVQNVRGFLFSRVGPGKGEFTSTNQSGALEITDLSPVQFTGQLRDRLVTRELIILEPLLSPDSGAAPILNEWPTTDLSPAEEAKWQGRPVWRIQGRAPSGRLVALWIDQVSRLVVRSLAYGGNLPPHVAVEVLYPKQDLARVRPASDYAANGPDLSNPPLVEAMGFGDTGGLLAQTSALWPAAAPTSSAPASTIVSDEIVVVSATYRIPTKNLDVTARVAELLQPPANPFVVNEATLEARPTTAKVNTPNRTLKINYTYQGKTQSIGFKEGEPVSYQALVDNAGKAGGSVAGVASTAPVQQTLTEQQMSDIVLIQGDKGVATGFLARVHDIDCVVTNLHVLVNNGKITVKDLTGAVLELHGVIGAVGADIALLRLAQPLGRPLSRVAAANVLQAAKLGDKVVVVGNQLGGGVATQLTGQIKRVSAPTVSRWTRPSSRATAVAPSLT